MASTFQCISVDLKAPETLGIIYTFLVKQYFEVNSANIPSQQLNDRNEFKWDPMIHCAGRALTSDLFVSSFVKVVYENVFSCTLDRKQKKILVDNH